MSLLSYLILPLIGIFIGFLISILGGGGGIFYVGILNIFFHLPMEQAVTTSLASVIPTTAMSGFSHYKNGNVDLKSVGNLIMGGIIGSIFGSYLSAKFSTEITERIFGIFIIIMGGFMFFSRKKSNKDRIELGGRDEKVKMALIIIFGLLGGIMSGLLGISGTPPILAGLYIMGYPAIKVVGTSTAVLAVIALSGFLSHISIGNVNWTILVLLTVGAVTGAFWGPKSLKRIDVNTLERFYGPIFMILMFIMGIKMLVG